MNTHTVTVNDITITTHSDNTQAMIQARVDVITMCESLGFIASSFRDTYTPESVVLCFYEKYNDYGVSISMTHPKGVKMDIEMTRQASQHPFLNCGLSGLGFKTIGNVDKEFTSTTQLKNRLKAAIKRAGVEQDAKNKQTLRARENRKPLVAIAKEVFGDDVKLQMYKGLDCVTALYKGAEFKIEPSQMVHFTFFKRKATMSLSQAKKVLDALETQGALPLLSEED
jgi:hypothetical protein